MSATTIKKKVSLFGPFRELPELDASTQAPCKDKAQQPRFAFGPVTRLQKMALGALDAEYQEEAARINEEIETLKDAAREQGVPLRMLSSVDAVLVARRAIKRAGEDEKAVQVIEASLAKVMERGGDALVEALSHVSESGVWPAAWTIHSQKKSAVELKWERFQTLHLARKAGVFVRALRGDWSLHMDGLDAEPHWPALNLNAMRAGVDDRGEILMGMEEDTVNDLIMTVNAALEEGMAAMRGPEKKP